MTETLDPREERRRKRLAEHNDPGPELPDVSMNLLKPREPGVGVVVTNEVCTARKAAGFVRHIEIDISKTPMAGAFRSGQSFGVVPPGTDEKGKAHKVRLYSLACPTSGEDGEGKTIATTVKRTIDEHWSTGRLFLGVASNWLADLAPGDEVPITGPVGKRFLLPSRPEEHDYVFVATGTGIAPFRGMLLDLLRAETPSKVTLIMGSPYATDLLYDAELRELAHAHERFTYLTAISRERQEDLDKRLYVQDRFETHRDALVPMLESDRTLIYLCGLAGMELGVFQKLATILPESRLSRYLLIDDEIRDDVQGWERGMVHRQIRPTRRVFVEVY